MKFLTAGSDQLAQNPGFELVGRDDELKRLSSILIRTKASSIILVGPGGVGSTALIMGLQASKDDPNSPLDIISKRFSWLDYDQLFASGNMEEINKSFQRILSFLKRTPDSVLQIEDTRDFIETARNAGCSHFINALNAGVKEGDFQVILEVRDEDLGQVLKAHSDFSQCYTIVDLQEPTGEALTAISRVAASRLADHHKIAVADDAVLKAIELTNRYQTKDPSLSRAQPERTTNLIDQALSAYRLSAHSTDVDPADHDRLKELYRLQRDGEKTILDLEEQIEKQLEQEEKDRSNGLEGPTPDDPRTAINAFRNLAVNNGFESKAVSELRARIERAQSIVDANKAEFDQLTRKINSSLRLTVDIVLDSFARLSGIPANKLNEDEREKLRNLAQDLKANLWGQDPVVEAVANNIKTSRIGQRNGNKPQASFLFMGPSGVGKTELTKQLSDVLDMELTRFDMSEYMEKHAVAKLIGAPPGYEGFDVGGILTNAMRKNPRRIVLFDEIEKADPNVFNVFLQILDAGRLTDNVGRVVSFSESIIIMTSNIGQPELLDMSFSREDRQKHALEVLIETPGIRPEFLNRFAGRQNIKFFDALTVDIIAKIVRREISGLDSAYRSKGIVTTMPDDELMKFCEDRYDVTIGGRGLPGYIQANLEPIITDTILNQPAFTGTLRVGYDGSTHRFTTELIPNDEGTVSRSAEAEGQVREEQVAA